MAERKHLSIEVRKQIEVLKSEKRSNCYIAKVVGVHKSTVSRELERGAYEHENDDGTKVIRYSAKLGQQRYDEKQSKKGSVVKIAKDPKLLRDLDHLIGVEGLNPHAALNHLMLTGGYKTTLSMATVYSYLEKGILCADVKILAPGSRLRSWEYKRYYGIVDENMDIPEEDLEGDDE